MSNEQLLLQYLRSIEESVKRIETSVTTHDQRISSLESTRSNMDGKITAAGAIITTLAGIVAWFVSALKH